MTLNSKKGVLQVCDLLKMTKTEFLQRQFWKSKIGITGAVVRPFQNYYISNRLIFFGELFRNEPLVGSSTIIHWENKTKIVRFRWIVVERFRHPSLYLQKRFMERKESESCVSAILMSVYDFEILYKWVNDKLFNRLWLHFHSQTVN